MSFDKVMDFGGIRLDPEEIWFLPLTNQRDPSALGLRVGLGDLADSVVPRAKEAVRSLLNAGLGEPAVEAEIQHLEVVRLPPSPEKQGYVPLTELPQFMEWRKSHKCEEQGESTS